METSNSNAKPAPIKSAADAEAFLAEHFPSVKVDGEWAVWVWTCGRCGGTGHYPSTQHPAGRCRECYGGASRGTKRSPLIAYAKARRAEIVRRLAAARKATAAAEKRDAERAAAAAAFLEAHDGLAEVLAGDHSILRDMAGKLATWGQLSDAQVALARKIAAELAAPKPAGADAPRGRVTIEARVVGLKWHYGDYGDTYKMTLRVDTAAGAYRVWCTVPESLLELALNDADLRLAVGDVVALTVTLEPSDKDATFAFGKRPAKAQRLARADAEAAHA